MRHRPVDPLVHLRRLPYIRHRREDLPRRSRVRAGRRRRSYRLDGAAERVFVDVRQGERRAPGEERFRRRETDAGGAARDGDDLAGEGYHRGLLLLLSDLLGKDDV